MRSSYSPPVLCVVLLQLMRLAQSDPDPLQDFCVADGAATKTIFLNGAPCMNPAMVQSSHFMTSALAKPGSTNGNHFGFNVTLTNTRNLPGSNTQGLAMARVDIARGGLVPPHVHPRASEVVVLLQGNLIVGFIDTSNRLFTQNLQPLDSFVFPRGMVHFLYNLGSSPVLAISGLNSQNPGAQLSALATFASKPSIINDVLMKAFQISGQDVERIRRNLGG